MSQVVMLQSGFLGFEGPDLVKPPPPGHGEVLQAIKLNKRFDRVPPVYHYDTRVEALMSAYRADPGVLKNFEFREQLLRTAKGVFQTPSLYVWCELQAENPRLLGVHREFLTDSLMYLTSGERRLNAQAWSGLLSPQEEAPKDAVIPYDFTPFFKSQGPTVELRGLNGGPTLAPWATVVGALQRWTSYPGGFGDLLNFLDAVFGKKA
jgi:hypothetical protein